MQGGTADIEFLARSETRVALVEQLRRDGELTRDELRARLDASRTTVQRNLDALVERGWLRNGNRTYALAPCGELIADEFLDLVETASVVGRLRPVLRWTDPAELDFDFAGLADADVVTASEGDPWAMVNRHVSTLAAADRARLVLPLTGLHAVRTGRDRVLDHGATAVQVASPEVVDTFLNDPAYRDCYDDLADCDRYELYRYDGEIPFYLGILDETVQIGVDEDGDPRALLETTDDDAYEWAERTFEEYRRDGERVS